MVTPFGPHSEPNEKLIADAIAESEAFLESNAQLDADLAISIANEIATDTRVVDSLLRRGIELPDPRKTGRTLTEELGYILLSAEGRDSERTFTLTFYAAKIAADLELIDAYHAEGEEFKPQLQLDILDDESISERDKAAVLDVYDELVPGEGLDLVADDAIAKMRADKISEEEEFNVRFDAKKMLQAIITSELIPVYGDHDNYGQLGSLIIAHVMVLRASANGILPSFNRDKADEYMKTILEINSDLGIPQDVLSSVISRVQIASL